MDLCSDEKGKFDELVDDKGVKILIDPKALMHVIGTEMDFVDDKLRYGEHSTRLFKFYGSPYGTQTEICVLVSNEHI